MIKIKDPPGNWILADGNVDSSTTSYTVPDLRPAMQYQFRVAAVNEVGEGSFSAPSETISLPQQRKYQCQLLTVVQRRTALLSRVFLSTSSYLQVDTFCV